MHRSSTLLMLLVALLAAGPLGGCVVVIGCDDDFGGGMLAFGSLAVDTDELASRRLTDAFPIAPGTTLRLANIVGPIRIEAGEGPDIEVEAVVRADAGSNDATARLLDSVSWRERPGADGPVHWLAPDRLPERIADPTIRRGRVRTTVIGRTLEITAPESGVLTWYADLVIRVPAGASLAVRNVSGPVRADAIVGDLSVDTGRGDVEIASIDGALTIDTSSGGVNIGPVRGPLRVDTSSGDVTVASVHGDARVDTASGDVSIGLIEGELLHADTSSGDIVIGTGRVASMRLDTGSGDIIVRGATFARLVADTSSGDVRIESDLAGTERIDADTGSGDVEIIAGPGASFRLSADLGSGSVRVAYDDAVLERRHGEIVGARRGDGRTTIRVDTGSGDCVVRR